MPKSAKLIIVILVLLLGASVFVVLNIFSQKQNLEKSHKTLQERAQQAQSRELKTLEEKEALEQQKVILENQVKIGRAHV